MFAITLFIGPVGEEFGWRGVALPLLQRRFAPLWASLILGTIWGVWHLPSRICLGDPRRTAPEKLKTAGLSSLARQYHDLDISRRLARWWLTGSVRRRAIVISTGAAINTNHVTKIARTSKR
jgi:membrane protease YdiL (CAAX protease family)